MIMTVETGPINLPPGDPDVNVDDYKIPEQGVPPREGFMTRARSRKAAPKPAAKKASERVPASKPGEFVEPLTQMYTMIGMGTVALDVRAGHEDHNCGPTIVENAEKIAQSWDELAQKNDNVRKALRTMLQGSAWAGVIGAHLPIAMAIFSNHAPGSVPTIMKPQQPEPKQERPEPVKRTPSKQYRRPPLRTSANTVSG